jgi:hypothetical protein
MKALLCTTSLVIAFAGPATSETIRFATFNASMNRADPGALKSDLESGTNGQIQAVAEIIQRVDPDVLLVNEFDYDPDNPALFAANYLSVPQNVSGRGPTGPVPCSSDRQPTPRRLQRVQGVRMQPRDKAEQTMTISAISPSTPQTSPMETPAICGSTTFFPRRT